MMIDRHTLTPIGILAVHFGSHDIAAAGDAVQKSSCRKFTQIGNDKRASIGESSRGTFFRIPDAMRTCRALMLRTFVLC